MLCLMAEAKEFGGRFDRIERRLRRRVARLTQRPLAPINTTSRLMAKSQPQLDGVATSLPVSDRVS